MQVEPVISTVLLLGDTDINVDELDSKLGPYQTIKQKEVLLKKHR